MSAISGWGRTREDIVAELEMVKTSTPGPYLIVEGESDECFFTPRIAADVYILLGCGRLNVERAIDIIEKDNNHKETPALGVIEEDYDWFTGYSITSGNILKFDPRDLEGMLVRSQALDCVLAELGTRAMINNFTSSNGISVRDAVAQRASLFGRIRIYNASDRRACLKAFKPQRFCDVRTWTYDSQAVLLEASRLGVHPDPLVLEDLVRRINPPSIWHAVRGHDLVDILLGGLLGVLGGNKDPSRKDVEMLLRQSMAATDVQAAGIFGRIRAWQVTRSCVLP